jgi:Phage Tail Collar Domain
MISKRTLLRNIFSVAVMAPVAALAGIKTNEVPTHKISPLIDYGHDHNSYNVRPCDGSIIDIEEYPELSEVLGYGHHGYHSFGKVRVPDLTDRYGYTNHFIVTRSTRADYYVGQILQLF